MNGFYMRRKSKYEGILQSAGDLFQTFGLRSVRMTDIAQAAGVSKVTIFKYFESKEKLIRECVRNYFENLTSEIRDVLQSHETYQTRMRRLIELKASSFRAFCGELFPWMKTQEDAFVQEILATRHNALQAFIIPFLNEGREGHYISTEVSNESMLAFLDVLGAGLIHSSYYSQLNRTTNLDEEIFRLSVRALLK